MLTTLTAGTAAVAALSLIGHAQAATPPATSVATVAAVDASTKAATTPWKHWSLQPGAAGVATTGISRTLSSGAADVQVIARDTAADKKGAYVWVLRYGTVPGHITKTKLNVPPDGRNHTWKNMGGSGLRFISVQECVDNATSWEVCSPFKTVWSR